MRRPLFQVDAFTDRTFAGNPAAVVPLETWLPDRVLQAIALENNLSETAFVVPEGEARWHLRWFTPKCEVDLCGHATLATAWVLLRYLGAGAQELRFRSRSGDLTVRRDGELLELDFPAYPPTRLEAMPGLEEALGVACRELWLARRSSTGRILMVVLGSEEQVKAVRPDLPAFPRLDIANLMVTAPGREVDFVSRYFAPASGIPEDPVTGSAHCTLAPYWASRLARPELSARQVSERGGELRCRVVGDRVRIAGRAAPYLVGEIEIPDPGR